MKKIRFSTRSNILDRLDLTLTPYLIDPISRIGNHKNQLLGIIGPTQSGKTVFLQAALCDAILQDPGNSLYILPDKFTAEKNIEEKIIKMIDSTKELSDHKTNSTQDIAKLHINLDNMTIYPAWAGSIPTMNSLPMKNVYWDEVRLMDLTIGSESNAIKLGWDRLTTYLDYQLGQGFMVSSPSIIGDLLFQQLSIHGTLFVGWTIECPNCGSREEPNFFQNMKLIRDVAVFYCQHCKYQFKDIDKKREMNKNGKYVPLTIDDRGWKVEKNKEFNYDDYKRIFWHFDSLCSPFRSFDTIYNEFLQTKDKVHDYKNFWQCWLSLFWIEDKSRTSTNLLKAREKNYLRGTVPSWCKILYAGGDTQDDGFFIDFWAFGSQGRAALVDTIFIKCPIDTAEAEDIIKFFNSSVFDRKFMSEDKKTKWKVYKFALDTGGHRTKQIYQAKQHLPDLIMIKGAHETQKTTITYSADYDLFLVRTSEYLAETEALSESPDFCLFRDVPEGYKQQFCNIRKVEYQNKKNGVTSVVWKKVGQCDTRFACVHAFICLDIPNDFGTTRHLLNDDSFSINPELMEKELRDEMLKSKEVTNLNSVNSDVSDYNINTDNWFT